MVAMWREAASSGGQTTLQATFSSNNGTSWSSPLTISVDPGKSINSFGNFKVVYSSGVDAFIVFYSFYTTSVVQLRRLYLQFPNLTAPRGTSGTDDPLFTTIFSSVFEFDVACVSMRCLLCHAVEYMQANACLLGEITGNFDFISSTIQSNDTSFTLPTANPRVSAVGDSSFGFTYLDTRGQLYYQVYNLSGDKSTASQVGEVALASNNGIVSPALTCSASRCYLTFENSFPPYYYLYACAFPPVDLEYPICSDPVSVYSSTTPFGTSVELQLGGFIAVYSNYSANKVSYYLFKDTGLPTTPTVALEATSNATGSNGYGDPTTFQFYPSIVRAGLDRTYYVLYLARNTNAPSALLNPYFQGAPSSLFTPFLPPYLTPHLVISNSTLSPVFPSKVPSPSASFLPTPSPSPSPVADPPSSATPSAGDPIPYEASPASTPSGDPLSPPVPSPIPLSPSSAPSPSYEPSPSLPSYDPSPIPSSPTPSFSLLQPPSPSSMSTSPSVSPECPLPPPHTLGGVDPVCLTSGWSYPTSLELTSTVSS